MVKTSPAPAQSYIETDSYKIYLKDECPLYVTVCDKVTLSLVNQKSKKKITLTGTTDNEGWRYDFKGWFDIDQTRKKLFSTKEFDFAPQIMGIDLTYHAKMSSSFVKELSYDKESKIRTCSATVSAMADKKRLDQYMHNVPQQYFTKDKQEIQELLLNKGIFSNDIRYELQNTDKGNVQIKIQGMRLQ